MNEHSNKLALEAENAILTPANPMRNCAASQPL
jgi:hypothetical protein